MRAFLLLGLVPAMVLAALAFFKARQSMQDEIERGLVNQAHAVAADVNKILFERLQNGAAWSTFEVMQDVQVQDVDKRLSNFLAKLQVGYGGVYRRLDVLNNQQQVVASSDAGALGQTLALAPVWKQVELAGAQLVLERPAEAMLRIRVALYNQYSASRQGELVLAVDWQPVQELLSHAAQGHAVLLLDSDGSVLASAGTLGGLAVRPGLQLADWQLDKLGESAFVHAGPDPQMHQVLAGLGRSPVYAGFSGVGLSVLVLQESALALAPVRNMALMSLAILLLLVLATVVAARKISATIADPIVALTAYTRSYQLGQDVQMPPPLAQGELGELGNAYGQMMRDIDQARGRLVKTAKLAVIGEMAAVIIHEVRTPLGILRSSAQMLRREQKISEQGKELLGFIESETARLNNLVSAMLDSARARPLYMARCDLHQLIRHAASLLANQLEQRAIVIEEALQAADPWLDGDSEQLTQVLLNLLHNAMQVMAQGGAIRISTVLDGHRLQVEMEDDGPGIAPADRSRVFEAFFFRREGGVGLGLAIVQQIIQAHAGEISVDAGRSGGARFIIRLPRQILMNGE
ncbi:ATP-binding protein [Duganella fentianensis]|uniref:ATP-binding protein n=1 Tax=Duganella fentianensis TaxID=2692177 RepID=UPI0032B2E424